MTLRRFTYSLLLAFAVCAWCVRAGAAQGTPTVAGDSGLGGIDAEVLASGTASGPLVDARLRFERITVPMGARILPHTSFGPELLIAASGDPIVTDSFGFSSPIPDRGGVFFSEPVAYTLSNQGDIDATIWRLSTSQGEDALPGSVEAGEPLSSIEVFIDQPLDDSLVGDVELSITSLTWGPEASTLPLGHSLPVGLLLLDGELFARSPSGLEGQLTASVPVVFPADVPIVARAGDMGPATALLIAVSPAGDPAITLLTPTPVPTNTLIPTETPLPTVTRTPSNTPTPTPTPDPNTAQGSILQLGEPWRSGDGSLVVDATYEGGNPINGAPEWSGHIIYTNMSNTRQDFVVPAGFIQIKDDNGSDYSTYLDNGLFDRSAIGSARVIIEAGSDFEADFAFTGTGDDGNVFIRISEFGPIHDASWGFTLSQRDMLPLAQTAQIGSLLAVDESPNGSAASQHSASNGAPAGTGSAKLPEELGSLLLNDQGARTQSEITSSFPNPAEADALFTQWGWSGSNYEVFVAPNGVTGDDGIYEVDIGIHQLAGPAEAAEALIYFKDARAALLGLWEANVDPLGNMSKALTGPSGEGGYEASVYVAVGSQVVRVTALSWNDYPLDSAISIMRQVIGG